MASQTTPPLVVLKLAAALGNAELGNVLGWEYDPQHTRFRIPPGDWRKTTTLEQTTKLLLKLGVRPYGREREPANTWYRELWARTDDAYMLLLAEGRE